MKAVTERQLLLLTGLLPIITIHLCYLVAASEGHVPWCFPYIDSCTSISATGRHGISFWLFKITMLPYAACLMIWWWRSHQLLIRYGTHDATIHIIGLIGGVFLILYVLALGAVGDYFQLTRRVGIIVYFSLTYLALLLFTRQWLRCVPASPWSSLPMYLLTLVLAIGLLTVVLDITYSNYDAIEDAFEWVEPLLIHLTLIAQALQLPDTRAQKRGSNRTP
ncbi:MAG: hypothetical protein AAF525_20785 [Pseudomonadota bacterium]